MPACFAHRLLLSYFCTLHGPLFFSIRSQPRIERYYTRSVNALYLQKISTHSSETEGAYPGQKEESELLQLERPHSHASREPIMMLITAAIM